LVALRYLALLRVPRPHHLPGHIILDYRQLVPRRPLYPNRARNSVGLAFERSTREAGTGSIHRGYNRYFPELGGHLWLQNALAAVLVLSTLPETILSKKIDGSREFDRVQRIKKITRLANPLRVVILLFKYPSPTVICTSSSLVWNMYSLLTLIRYVLNLRIHLTSPIQSGLFYIAPGIGYLLGAGSFFGGVWTMG